MWTMQKPLGGDELYRPNCGQAIRRGNENLERVEIDRKV